MPLEVVLDILKRSRIRSTVQPTATRWSPQINTLIGRHILDGSPHKNICKTPIFGGQWVKGEKWPYDLKIVDNTVNQLFAPEQKIKPMPW